MTTKKPADITELRPKRKRNNGVHTRVIQCMVTPETFKKFQLGKAFREFRGTREYITTLIEEEWQRVGDKEINQKEKHG